MRERTRNPLSVMYSIKDLNKEFPSEDACLAYVFKQKYPSFTGYYRIKKRKCFCNAEGHTIYPLKGTIFEKSKTPLTLWFYALFIFSSSKHGVSAAELSRQIGVTYKCAYRMGMKIRSLMKQGTQKLSGVCEADETYIGARFRSDAWKRKHAPVLGMVKRGGEVRAIAMDDRTSFSVTPFIERNLRKKATLYTDGARVYDELRGYKRGVVWHSYQEYVRGKIHTNTIENFWGGLKKSIRSTYRGVSKQHLQQYVNEMVFVWNHRETPFLELLKRL